MSALDNDAERKRLFEQLFIAGMASGKSIDQLTVECGQAVDRLCPKRTYKPTPTPGPGRVIKNTGSLKGNLMFAVVLIVVMLVACGVWATLATR